MGGRHQLQFESFLHHSKKSVRIAKDWGALEGQNLETGSPNNRNCPEESMVRLPVQTTLRFMFREASKR
eukprot:2483644-Amphidinium_carterae.1